MAAGLSMSTISEVHRSAVTSSSSTPSSPTSNRPSQPPPPPPIMELTPSTLTRLTSAVTAPPPPTPPTSTTPSATTSSSSSSLHTTSPSAPDTTDNNHPIDFASGAAPAAAVSSDATSCSAVGHTPGPVATTAAAAATAPPAQVIVLTTSSGGSSTCAVPSLANHREAGTAAAACSLPLSPPSPHTKSPSVAVKHLSKLMVGLVNAAPLPATPPLGLIKQPPPLHINHHPFSHHGQDNTHMDTTEDTHKKRRCADRYDSSESSDSGVATLSCTDSSTASSDGSDPGSPYSPSSSSCDDPNQQPGTLPSVSITLSTTKPILTTPKTNLPHVWPWSNNFTTQVPQLSISTMTNPPPLAKSSKRTSMISSSDPMAASIKKIRTASTKPLALVAAAPKLKPMPALATPITVSNPQTKITGFFKSQIKSVNTVKRDLTNLVVRSTEFPTKNHLDSFATHHNPYTHPANITAIACDPVDVRTAHITTVAPMQSQPAYKKVDRKTAKVAPLMVNSRKVSLTPSTAPKKKPQSIAPRILPAEPTKKPNEPQKSMLGNPTNVILGGFRVPPQQQMVAPMQYITSSISQQVTTHPPPPPVLMTSARTTKIALPVYHHPHNPPLVMPKLVQIPKDQQHTQANHRVNTSPNQQRPTQPHYFLNGALIKLQTLGPDMSNANLQTVANKPFVHQTNQPQYTTQPQLFMTTSSGLLLANGMPAVINSSPMTINTHAAMPALHPYSANTPTVLPNIATLIQNQMQTNFVQASTQSVQQHFNSHPSMHLQPNQMSLVVSHTPFDEPINHQSTINTKVIKPQIRITSSSHTPIQSNLITTFAPTNSLANGSKVVPRHTMSSPPPLISSNTPPPLCISKPFASSPAAARLLITISPVTSPTSISSPRTTRPLPSPSCLPMLTPIQSLPEVYVATSAPTSTPTTTPTTPTTLSPHIIPSCPPCLPSPKSLVLERIQRLKPDVCDEPSTSCSSPTSIDTDLLSVALPDCAKSPILSQPKTIRFPAAGSSRSGVRRSDGRLVGVCYWDGCEQKYDTSSKLLDHLQTQHVNTQSGPFACEWSGCKVHGRESCSRRWLERHVLSHGGTKQFKCIVDNCGLRFGSQLTLEKHVNSHFNTSETKDQAPRRVSDPLIPKKLRVHGKKLRYRRQPFSARMFDFFDNGIMEILQHRLTHTEVTVCGTRGSVVFTGTQIGKRVTGIGGIEHLVRWSPPEILPDEWLPESSALIVQSTLPASLDSYGSSGCSSSASSVSSASFTLNSSSTTSTSISKSVRIQTMAQAQRIALQRYLRVVYQNTSNHPPNVQYTEHLLATAAAPTVKKNRRKTTRKCTAS